MITTSEGTTRVESKAELTTEASERLRTQLEGRLIRPMDVEYDDARRIWNAMIDRRPALTARCEGAADVARCVAFARERDLLVSVRGGGHNIAGSALCHGGLVIDLSQLRRVEVDAAARRATVLPGATLADVDRETQTFGLATPLGINSTTGIAGLTLGGGFGWLTRKLGFTVDNLVAADLVTADARMVRASADEHPDLFWAIRGGGGNFGVVTRFEFALHPVGPEVLSGLVFYPHAEARPVLRQYAQWVEDIPDDLTVWIVLRAAPPLPFLPASVHGQPVLALAVFHAGEPARGEALIEPLRSFGTILGEHVGVQPYCQWQQAFDPLLTPGMRNYWKSHNFTRLGEGAIDVALDYASRMPSPHCEVFFGLLGGAAGRAERSSAAYPHRDAKLVMNVHGRWERASEDAACIGWSRSLFDAMSPHASGGVYVNFLTEDEGERIQAAYGENYTRLASVKKRYDPDNLFRAGLNIRPAA